VTCSEEGRQTIEAQDSPNTLQGMIFPAPRGISSMISRTWDLLFFREALLEGGQQRGTRMASKDS
jgi:hypothetical protein